MNDLARLREWIEEHHIGYTAVYDFADDVMDQIETMLAASPAPGADAPEIVVTDAMIRAFVEKLWPNKTYAPFMSHESIRAVLEAALRQGEG